MEQKFSGIEVEVLSSCVPKRKIGNDHFDGLLSPKELRIFEKTVGIFHRRYSATDETASDLGFEAATAIFESNAVKKEEIECIIYLSQTSDYKIPFTSNILQERLGIKKNVLCIDINGGCAGFIQGLGTAFSLAQSLANGKILFIVAETLSKIISFKDRGTAMLFGDGASACIIANTRSTREAFFNYFSDGSGFDAIMIPDGGYRNPVNIDSLLALTDQKGNSRNNLHIAMDGTKVFDFTLREIAPGVRKILHNAGLNIDKIDYFLLHQSNRFIINQIASQLQVTTDKFLVNIQDYGNTSGVSIPLLMTSNADKLQNQKVLLSGYGSGLNWGNAVMDFSFTKFLPLIEK